jgi:hypothetical protein
MNREYLIPCKWREIPEFLYSRKGQPNRKARYHGSVFSQVKDFGSKRWVVCGYLEIDYEPYLREGVSKEEVARRCIEYLNRPPDRKKYQKKKVKPLYGSLTLYDYKFKNDGAPYIEVVVVTDERKNKNFWGQGIST